MGWICRGSTDRNRRGHLGISCLRRHGRLGFRLCVSPPDNLDGLSSAQLKELVASLFARLSEPERTVAEQRAEIARLKGLKGCLDIKPSGMDTATTGASAG
jgi:hypothetical protein